MTWYPDEASALAETARHLRRFDAIDACLAAGEITVDDALPLLAAALRQAFDPVADYLEGLESPESRPAGPERQPGSRLPVAGVVYARRTSGEP